MRLERRPALLRRLLLAVIGALLDDLQVQRLAGTVYDQALANTAIALAARQESERDDDLAVHLGALAGAVLRRNPQAGLQYLVQSADGRVLAGQRRLAALAAAPSADNPVLADGRLDGRPLRVATYRYAGPDGEALIVVAEGLAAREAAARQALRSTLWTNLALAAAVLLVVTLGVRLALQPLQALGAEAGRHDTGRLQPLATGTVPREVLPLVDGINRLLGRLQASLQAQQDFVNASAHQLRTPLAGLQAQLDLLIDEQRGTALMPRLTGLRSALQRLTRVTQQMLALARTDAVAQAGLQTGSSATLDLEALLQAQLQHHLDAALARRVDLGLETAPASVQGEAWMLQELVANLVDNALRYAPPDSQVTLRCDRAPEGGAFLAVEDAGPGIAPAQRQRVLQRFVRLSESDGPGSGLGLAIVQDVARAHGAQVQIGEGQDGRGTVVRVLFPQPGSSNVNRG